MKKRLLALLCAVLCLSAVSCGKKDSSSEKDADEDTTTTTTAAAEADKDESKSDSDSSKEDTTDTSSEAGDSKQEDSADADVKEPDSSKADDTGKTGDSKADSSKSDNSSSSSSGDKKTGSGNLIKGTGYTLEVNDKWTDFGSATDDVTSEITDKVGSELGIDTGDFEGMDIFLYYDDGDLSDGAPALTVVKPTYDAVFESLTINDVADLLESQFEAQFSSMEGVSLESRGVVKYGDGEFLELYTAYDLPEAQARARQFYTFHKGYQYIISFSSTPELYNEIDKEADEIMKTFKFTEG